MANTTVGGPASITIVIPTYNDWTAAWLLVESLELGLSAAGLRARVLFVDDGSVDPIPAYPDGRGFASISEVNVLSLRRNLGHQRAIAVGLAYVERNVPSDIVVVMDGDGEDSPADVPRLIAAVGERPRRRIAFAGREKRSEGPLFRAFYGLYKSFYRLLTGKKMRVGNFSALPEELLKRVVAVSEIWLHYSAGLYRSRLPYTEVSTARAKRLHGRSQMNFVSLVTHGLSAIAVHSDVVGTRLMVATGMFGAVITALLSAVVVVRVATPLAIPGWATTASGLLLLLLTQGIMFSLFFAFIVLNARTSNSFLPCRDFEYFVLTCQRVWPPDATPVRPASAQDDA